METADPSRRTFLRVTGLGAALGASCAPAAAPAAGPAAQPAAPAVKAQWEKDWDDLVAAAKKEGQLNYAHANSLGALPRKALDQFTDTFRVKVEVSSFNSGSLLVPRAIQEQQAGVHTWDISNCGTTHGGLMRDGKALDPMRPLIFRPDAMDTKAWSGGFEAGYGDRDRTYGYGISQENYRPVFINTDQVKDGELKTVADLLNPKWKGKLLFTDPRSGGTNVFAAAIRLAYGEEYLKRLFVDMEPVYTQDVRQIAEQMVRGQRAISLGPIDTNLREFRAQGLGNNVKAIELPDVSITVIGNYTWFMHNAPHPNAAKLYINWLLTKEGQTAHSQAAQTNSRRLDVAPGNPESVVVEGKKVVYNLSDEASTVEQTKTTEILLKLVR